MAVIQLDAATEATLKRLSAQRGQTKSEVIRDAIARLAAEEGGQISALDRLRPFVGIIDSGGRQLSKDTGARLRRLFAGGRKRA